MDRREALKKLGAGGVLIVASPVILPSIRVAHAASPGETGLTGVPAAGDPLPYQPIPFPNSSLKKTQVTVAPDHALVTCEDQSPPIVSCEWRIISVTWQKSKAAYLRITEAVASTSNPVGTQLVAMPPSVSGFSGPTGYSAPSYASGFLIRKGSSTGDVKIDQRDRFDVEARVRWHCDGATSDVEAEYVFSAIGTDSLTVTNSTWNIVPA